MRNEYDILNETKLELEMYEQEELTDMERKIMKDNIKKSIRKKGKNWRKIGAIAACVACSAALLSQTAFAQELVENLIKMISTGSNQYAQYEGLPEPEGITAYDENGNALEKVPTDGSEYYVKDSEGELVKITEASEVMLDDGTIVKIVGENDADIQEGIFNVSNIDEVQQYLDFEMKRLDTPGYEFVKAELYTKEDGSVSGDYLMLEYRNTQTGKPLTSHQRILNDETAFSMGTDEEIREVTVNGNKAVIIGDDTIDWEENGASYNISAQGNITGDALIEAAENMK